MNEILVNCSSGGQLQLSKLTPLQGNLKTMKQEGFDKLKSSLIKYGIIFPFYVWREVKGDESAFWLVDGHQRTFVLNKLAAEGYAVPERVPVVIVPAKDIKEAKTLVLLASSRYAKIDDESLYEYIDSSELDWDELKKTVDLADMNMEVYENGWGPEENKAAEALASEEDTDDKDFTTVTLSMPKVVSSEFLKKLQPILDSTEGISIDVE